MGSFMFFLKSTTFKVCCTEQCHVCSRASVASANPLMPSVPAYVPPTHSVDPPYEDPTSAFDNTFDKGGQYNDSYDPFMLTSLCLALHHCNKVL